MGVSNLDAPNDDVFEYKSTLFKSAQNIKESLLQIIFQYRKKWTKFSLNCLNALLQASCQDLSRSLARYLRNLEPPNYAYARYTDWVRPYLEDHALFLAKNMNIQSTKHEFSLC